MFIRVVVRLGFAFVVGCLAPAQPAWAQHQHDHPDPAAGSPPAEAPSQPEHLHGAGAAALFPARDASGTAWLPDASPMHGFHHQIREWEVMLHGNAFVQVLHEDAPEHRGATQAGSINWIMAMARRPAGPGRLGLRGMVSLEPWTIGGCGYPNLLATGEVCDGDTIHDRQHPHDFVMELAGEFDRPLTDTLRWRIYGGLAGEPALGPPGFPHRMSAMPNPVSPITHHWLDSTHITFGVLTTGIYTPRWKAEGSIFNGREPDERRYNLDLAPLDSAAGRLGYAPTDTIALQLSAGFRSRHVVQPIRGERKVGARSSHPGVGRGFYRG